MPPQIVHEVLDRLFNLLLGTHEHHFLCVGAAVEEKGAALFSICFDDSHDTIIGTHTPRGFGYGKSDLVNFGNVICDGDACQNGQPVAGNRKNVIPDSIDVAARSRSPDQHYYGKDNCQ